MFNIFKKKCPVCKMKLEKGQNYPKGWDMEFCSEDCREEYRKKMIKEKSNNSGGCCH